MLRRNLPLWKAEDSIQETVAFCEETGIEEIIWKVDAEEFNSGFTSAELVQEYLPWLEKARDLQSQKAIAFSINPWLTLNHTGRCRYPDGPPHGFWWRVKPNGKEANELACPLSPGWIEWILETYRLYASTKPDKLWLEDDFRTYADSCNDAGCFCSKHLAAFAESIGGAELSRKELVERLTKLGKPDPIRSQWLDFQGKIMVGVCKELERVVHEVSPSTRLGLMNSWSSDGRWWEEAINALAGPHRPLARTSLAPYQEGRATDFLPDSFDILKETELLPENTENCPELENSLYTEYSKSIRMTRLQIMMSQVLGNPGITMNLFDMVGSPTSEAPRVGKMLKELRPLIDGIASVAGYGGRQRGVSIPFPKRCADATHVETGQGLEGLRFDGDGWAHPLQGSGIPVFMNGVSPVSAVTGQSLRALRDNEIDQLLQGGLLLDGSAASVLCEMGYEDQIGIRPEQRVDRQLMCLSAERDDWAENASPMGPEYISLRHIAKPGGGCERLYPLTMLPGAYASSVYVDPHHRDVMPGMVIFENAWGGRVAVYPFDLSNGITAGFMNWKRRRQLQRIVRWLGRDRVDLFVDGGAWMMPVRRDYQGYTMIAVLNFETDDWEEIILIFEWSGSLDSLGIDLLRDTGEFMRVQPVLLGRDGVNIRIRIPLKVAALDFAVLRIFS